MKRNWTFSLNQLAAALSISVVTAMTVLPLKAEAQVTFRNAITGDVIDFSFGKKR
jgi:cytochrome c-L